MSSKERPYVLFVAEIIYSEISKIKKLNKDYSNVDAINNFIGSKIYKDISSGEFHNEWFKKLEKDNYIDQNTKKKIPDETIKLLEVQKNMMVKQLIQFPNLYDAKSHDQLKISHRAFDHLWRICENYELWCKETKQENLVLLNIID